MGEEYGEEAPFQYFISHTDPGLVDAVRNGRRSEFAAFGWQEEPPDPQNEATFLRAKLNHQLRRDGRHRILWELYRELLALRKQLPPLVQLDKERCEVTAYDQERVLCVRRWLGVEEALAVFNFSGAGATIPLRVTPGRWLKKVDSSEAHWQGSGSSLPHQFDAEKFATLSIKPTSFALFVRAGDEETGGTI